MSLETRQRQINIDSSVGNLFSPQMPQTLLWPMGAVLDTIREAHYRGVEWHPMRTWAGMQMRAGLISQDDKNAFVSLHQSYRNEKHFREAWNHPNRGIAVASYFLLPERVSSLDNLERAQEVIGRTMPVVLYPSNEGEESGLDRPFGEKLIQPSPEVMEIWGVQTSQEFAEEAQRRGYKICLDLLHVRRVGRMGLSLGPWQQAFEYLLPDTSEIHVPAERSDQKQSIDTQNDFQAFLTKRGTIIEMLREIRNSGREYRVVTEMKNSYRSAQQWVEGNRQIVEILQDQLA